MKLSRNAFGALIFSLALPLGAFALLARITLAAPDAPADRPYFVTDQIIIRGPANSIQLVVDRIRAGFQITLTLIAPPVPVRNAAGAPIAIELFQISNASVGTAVALVNREGAGLNVTATPNYRTVGSKWIVDGSPVAAIVPGASSGQMRSQWALGVPGIRLYTTTVKPPRTVTYTGQGVHLYVLDSSPYSGTGTSQKNVHGVVLTVIVSQTVAPLTTTGALYQPGHGTFVAGLANAVAPSASLYLVKVLDDYGRGNLFELERAVVTVINREIATPGANGAVMNLSLGVLAGTDPLTSLVDLLNLAMGSHGILPVAAAGNDTLTKTAPMRLPASANGVIGVAGTNAQRARSCFSNTGDIAAPGGNGDPQCNPAAITQCASQPHMCLVSWFVTPTQPAGYGYGAGTSFASPLVAGAAALFLHKSSGALSPPQVAQAIFDSASPVGGPELGAGILNLCKSLGRCGRYLSAYLPILTR